MPIYNPLSPIGSGSNLRAKTGQFSDIVTANSSVNFALNLGEKILLYRASLSSVTRLRLYSSIVARDDDANRPLGTRPLPGHGLVLELATAGVAQTFELSPVVWAVAQTVDKTMPGILQNLSEFDDELTVDLNYYEA